MIHSKHPGIHREYYKKPVGNQNYIHFVMRLWIQWIWLFMALCSFCQAISIYSYPNLKNANRREWLKSLYKMALNKNPQLKEPVLPYSESHVVGDFNGINNGNVNIS